MKMGDTLTGATRNLGGFQGTGYDKGRSKAIQAIWFAVQNLVFASWWLPASARPRILRLFGASIGKDVFIRHRVRVLWPWKLTVGDNTWIGEGVWLLNLEPITLGHDVCLSQESFLCAGAHDLNSPTFEYDNGPITVESHVWVGARAMLLRGVRVGAGSVISAGSRLSRSVPAGVLARPDGSLSPLGG